jgi:uncharacterized protein (TIGR02231 family)
MKTRISILLIFVVLSNLFASNEITVKPILTGAKVFLRGAELEHNIKQKLEKGITDLIITNLASNIDQNSINISATGDAIILSVVKRFNYLKPVIKNRSVKELEDSLEILNQKILVNANKLEIMKLETELLLANKEIRSDNKGVAVSELQLMADFFRKRLSQIKSDQLIVINENKKIEKEIDRIKKQLSEINNKLNQPSNEIVVTLSVKNTTNLDLKLTYFINDAGWTPVYDIRVDNLNSHSKLNYKANVWQSSSIDWNDIKIVLSTRNPIQSNSKPVLYPWFIDFQQMVLYNRMDAMQKSMAAAPMKVTSDAKEEAETLADYISVDQKQLSVEFIPSLSYSIPSDRKPHSVSINEFSIPAKYEYYAVPKLDNNAFLIAYLTNWNEFNLLPGNANIYFENSYVGQSFIDPFTSKDTLAISLGRDQNIVVNRNVLKDFTEDKFLSSDVERFFGYEVVIKNNKGSNVKILVEDQIPISKNEEIEVKLIELSGAKYFADDAKIHWMVDIAGSKSITKKLVFSVRYPKDKIIDGL